jgi:perosamine synthetase
MNPPLFIASSPNTEKDDFFLALRLLFQPWKWNKSKYNKELEESLKQYLGVNYAASCDSGRTALYLTLKALGVKEGDEVITPSFTCLVVANAVRWTKATPIYLDTSKEDFNVDLESLENKVTPKTAAVVVQHTFGKKVDINRIKEILEKKRSKAFIIEDFAHTIKRNQKLEGDVAFLTFGIEKVISSVRGGVIVTNDPIINDQIQKELNSLPSFSRKKTFICLMNPIFWFFANPLHAIGLGRYNIGVILRGFWRKLGFLGIMIEHEEHKGQKPKWFPAKMSPALSLLAINQLKKLDKFNEHRTKLASIYHEKLAEFSDEKEFDEKRVYLRYPILLKTKEERNRIWEVSKSINITLGDWYRTPLYSKLVNEETYKTNCFAPEETPVTVDKTTRVLNLPTAVNTSEKRARQLAEKIALSLKQ